MRAKSVLISGAGIAGPTLAFWLNAAGFKTTIVERAPGLRAGGYVIDFWGLGYDIAERMGLASELRRVGYSMREMRIVDARGERVAGFGTRVFRELTGGRFMTLARSDLARLLFETVKGETEVLFGDRDRRPRGANGLRAGPIRASPARARSTSSSAPTACIRTSASSPSGRSSSSKGTSATPSRRSRRKAIARATKTSTCIYSEPGRMVGRVALRDDRTLFLFVFTRR